MSWQTLSAGPKFPGRGGRSGGDSVGVVSAELKIFVKDVADRQGRKRPLSGIKTWSTVKDVKDALHKLLHIPVSAQRLYFGPLLTSGGELPNHRSLQDAGIYRSGETLLLDIQGGVADGASVSASITSLRSTGVSDVCVSPSLLDLTPRALRRTVQRARRGFALGLKPDLVLDGSGGTYYLHDARKVRAAVFKPADEEPYAENNPRGYVRQGGGSGISSNFGFGYGVPDEGMREGICPGEACVREVAAYLLDHGGFSGVPATTLAEARHPAFNLNGSRLKVIEGGASVGSHSLSFSSAGVLSPAGGGCGSLSLQKKVGSFQEYVNAECSMDDLSPSKLTVEEVHKIAILDIRLLNADRNSANLLCRCRPEDPDYMELIPIDHGYCLRTVADVSWFDWCWLDWAQTKEPLSKKAREYVLELDIEADVRLLEDKLHIRGEALDLFRASSKLLQDGVKAGLTLHEIAVMCCRNDDAGEVPSKLESLMSMSGELTTSAIENGRWHHAAATRALEDQLASGTFRQLPNHKSFGNLHQSSLPFMLKSASSANFSSFASSKETDHPESLESSSRNIPGLMQSSASDNSSSSDISEGSFPGDGAPNNEECEEWAATIVADVSMLGEEAALLKTSRLNRSGSIDSKSTDDSSGTPVGFWYTRPNDDEEDEEDIDITWSPHISPKMSAIGVGASLPLLPLSSFPKGVSQESLVPPASDAGGTPSKLLPASVRFDVSPAFLPSSPHPLMCLLLAWGL